MVNSEVQKPKLKILFIKKFKWNILLVAIFVYVRLKILLGAGHTL